MKNKVSDNKLSKGQVVCFVLIGLFCVFAIFEAVYVVLFSVDGSLENVTPTITNMEPDAQEELKENFQMIFQNKLVSNVDITTIERRNDEYDLVYVAYEKIDKNIGKYDLNVQIPHININSSDIYTINNEIDRTFKEKAESIIKDDNTSLNTVYNIKYQAFLNNDVLSLIIQCTLKENENAQRILIKTYNYNIKTGKASNIKELTEIKQLSKNTVENKIKEEISGQISMEKSLKEAGYTVFNRDQESDIYKFDNLNNFFLDEKNNLYIIFAYGNNNSTSEMDIVIF